MVEKFRPNAVVKETYGEDGRDFHREIIYSCPKCGRTIGGYRRETACDKCGTFYDWTKEAKIRITAEAVYS